MTLSRSIIRLDQKRACRVAGARLQNEPYHRRCSSGGEERLPPWCNWPTVLGKGRIKRWLVENTLVGRSNIEYDDGTVALHKVRSSRVTGERGHDGQSPRI